MTDDLSDEEVSAYLDGALGPAQTLQVGIYLATHPREAAREAAYRAQHDAMRALYDPVLLQAPPRRLRAVVRRHCRRAAGRRFGWALIAAGLGLVALGIGGRMLRDHLPAFHDAVLSAPAPHHSPASLRI